MDNKLTSNDKKDDNNSFEKKKSTFEVKYEKKTCFYCSEGLDAKTFGEHILSCGQVLEKCPHSCASYIPRKRIKSHLKDCPKVKTKLEEQPDSLKATQLIEYKNRMTDIEKDIASLRSILNEEIKQRLHLIADVGNIRKHKQMSDEWTQNVSDVLTSLQKCVNEESSIRNTELQRCQEDIQQLFNQYRELLDWRTSTITEFNKIQSGLVKDDHLRENFMFAMEDQDFILKDFHKIKLEFNELKFQLTEIVRESNLSTNYFTDKINKIEEKLNGQWYKRKSLRFGVEDVEQSLDQMRNDLQMRVLTSNDVNAKQMSLDYEVKTLKNIVHETEEKCDRLERLTMESNRVMHQTSQGLQDLELNLVYQRNSTITQNNRGHMIWKITDFTARLLESREYETCLQGPVFSNKQYGYALRLELYLNGIGAWRNRSMVTCLTVIPGEYDSLLQWPCKLQADVILRDQPDNIANGLDYLRTTLVKKQTDDYFNNQYIHIPHKVLESRNYIRNDTIFLEVKLLKSGYVSVGPRRVSKREEIKKSRCCSSSKTH